MNTTISGALLFFLQGNGAGGGLVGFIPILMSLGIVYFIVLRPYQKQQRRARAEREQLLKARKPGDKVITSGGIYGSIVAIKDKDDTVQLRIAPSVSIEVLRNSIAGLQSSEIKEVEATK